MKNITLTFLLICIFPSALICQAVINDSLMILDSAQIKEVESIKPVMAFPWNYDNNALNKDAIENNSNYDLTRRLQSTYGGLNILANSYTPGASSNISFRGIRSILNGKEPLILLNGMPISNLEIGQISGGYDQSNRLIDIDPTFIENITFEGSAAGRAKYGIAGANGVILLETKASENKKLSISFQSTLLTTRVSQLPALQSVRAQGRLLDGQHVYLGPSTSNGFSWGPWISDLYYDEDTENPFDRNGDITPDKIGKNINAYNQYDFFVSGLSQNYSLGLSKATEKLSANIVGSFTDENGVIPTNSLTRLNLGIGLHYKPIEKLTISLNSSFSNTNVERSNKGSNLNGVMLGLLRTSPSFDNSNGLDDPLNNPSAYEFEDGSQRSYRHGIYDNPYWTINKNNSNDLVTRQIIQLAAKYEINQKLSIAFNSNYDGFNDERSGGHDIDPSIFRTTLGDAFKRNINYSSENINLATSYNALQKSDLDLTLTLAYEYNQSKITSEEFIGTILNVPGNVTIENAQEIETFTFVQDVKRAGAVASFDMNVKEKLDLTGSFRLDNSNRFGQDNIGFASYGLGGAYKVIQINGANNNNLFNASLEGSIGSFGNYDEVSFENRFTPAFISGDGFLIESSTVVNGLEPLPVGKNPLLTAERTNAYDIGIVMNLLNFMQFKIQYYNENTTGIILQQNIAASSGVNSYFNNIAEIKNSGFDVSLNADIVNNKKFKWNLDLQFNNNSNEVMNLDEVDTSYRLSGFESTNSNVEVGQPYGIIKGTGFRRDEDGNVIIGEDGWPLVAPKQKVLADPNPDWVLFLNNSFSLGKYLKLSATVEIKQGGEIWCGTCGVINYFGTSQVSVDEVDNIITFDGVYEDGTPNNTSVNLASTTEGQYTAFYRVRYGFGGISEMNIHDASWIKLRNINLTYDLSPLLNSKYFPSIKVSFVADNIFLRNNYPGIDPETNLTGNSGGIGIDYFNNPGVKRYGIKLDIQF